VISISSTSTSAIQEAHLVAVHAICAAVERHLAAPEARPASVVDGPALAASQPEARPAALSTQRAFATPSLARRAGLRLLVIGDALLDRDIVGRSERLAPDAPVPVVDVHAVHDRPGGAGLAALLAVRSGVEVVLATGLGQDAAGRRVRELLGAAHVEVHDVVAADTTPGKTRVRVRGQSLLRVDDAGHLLGGDPSSGSARTSVGLNGTSHPLETSAAVLLEQLAEGCDAVLVADYGGAVTRDPDVRAAIGRLTGRCRLSGTRIRVGSGRCPGAQR
jgi:hypothetical protein